MDPTTAPLAGAYSDKFRPSFERSVKAAWIRISLRVVKPRTGGNRFLGLLGRASALVDALFL